MWDEVTRTEDGIRVTTTEQVTKELDRGFIRSLISVNADNVAGVDNNPATIRRFNFQFNPQDINQTVQMRQDIYLPVLQDPAQLVQPLSAVATFAFDILIDRTMEVANGGGRTEEVDLFGTSNPATDVYQVGVVSDLQMLYSIIGQGISKELINQNIAVIKGLAARVANDLTDPDDQTAATSAINSYSTTTPNINIGNSGFLTPLPVRVVFSDLFMVDGFVTETNVKYTKFNTAMVPIQAVVGLTMNALYIGFAREDTFLTNNIQATIDQALSEAEEEKRQSALTNAEILNAARQSANVFVVACDPSDSWLDDLGRTDKDSQIVRTIWYAYGNPYRSATGDGYRGNTDREFKIGFKDSKYQSEKLTVGQKTNGSLGGGGCKIEKLYEDGVAFTVTYDWKMDVYGSYDMAGAFASLKEAEKTGRPNLMYGPPAPGSSGWPDPAHRGTYSGSKTASDTKTWQDIRSDSIREGEPETVNNGPYPYPNETNGRLKENEEDGNPGQPDDPDNPNYERWFVIHLTGTVTIDGTQKTFSRWKAIRGDQGYYHEETLGWPNNTGYGVYDVSSVPTTSSSNT